MTSILHAPRVATTFAALIVAASLSSAGAGAQEVHGSATIYGWLPWMDADTTSKSGAVAATTSLSAGDVLDALDFAFMAAGEIHYGRFGLLQDVVYADLSNSGNLSGQSASKVNVGTQMLLSTTAFGYRVYDQDGWQIEPYAGARYVSLETDVKVTGGGPLGRVRAAGVDLNWWDPIIGIRGRAPITQKLSASGFADIGGFGAGSKFSWEIFAGLDYAVTPRISAAAGFRYLSIDYESDRADLKLHTYGPLLGATFRF